MIREAKTEDLKSLLELYLYLHEETIPEDTEKLQAVWMKILNDENHHIIVNEINGKIVSSCVCVIIPNLTRGGRPYALIENVVTHEKCRGKGYASACLGYTKELAKKSNCYKMMLMTGSKREETLNFYRSAGFNCTDKTGFVQWL